MPRRDHGDIEVLALANRSASHWPDASGARPAVTIRYHRYHIKSAQRLVSCQLAAQHTSDRQEQCRSDCAAVFSVQLSCKAVREAALDRAEARHVDVSTIPVIDIADIARDSRSERAIGAEMLSAAEGIGFFYIRNTAVPQTLIDRVLDISRRFFAAAPDAKAGVTVNAGHRGFIRVGEAKMTENAQPDLKESFIWGLDTPGEDGIPPNRWPDFLPELRNVLTTFFTVGNAVGWSLLRAVATALDISPDSFVRTTDRPISRGSIIYYPEQPPSGDRFGVSSHTDYGCLTLLYQDDTGGLQVQDRHGEWLAAPPIEGSFVVNVGDLLARWSNDRFRSTPHRVINRSGRARYSTALFVDPNRDTLIVPVTRPGEDAHYPSTTCENYLRSRLDAAFDYRKRATAQS